MRPYPNPEDSMQRTDLFNRRSVLQATGASLLGTLAASRLSAQADEAANPKGNIKQSVCRWCYGRIKLPELATAVKKIGYQSIELLSPAEIKTVKEFGLTCSIMRCANGIENGVNRKENHAKIVKQLRDDIDFAVAEGIPNVLTMSGNRKGMPDDVGLENSALALKQILGYAEEKRITICMEGLNSKVDHKDYMYDRTSWGVALCKKLGSDRFKLLYDIYHMQIMEGDVIRTIRQNKDYIGHYHTGGNPGRHEIDDTQELNYPAIVKAILATGYTGFLGQEFIPVREPIASLAQGFHICDV
jgi:hydroxypyruvate isomerase